jgi:oligopeptide/dipeptide ABC transporter ATP-binding protein
MYAGEIVETGTVAGVYVNPRHPYTHGLLSSVPDFEAPATVKPRPIPGAPPDLAAPPPGCAFNLRCEFADEACLEGVFPLRDHGDGRASACIHYERMPTEPVIAPMAAGSSP